MFATMTPKTAIPDGKSKNDGTDGINTAPTPTPSAASKPRPGLLRQNASKGGLIRVSDPSTRSLLKGERDFLARLTCTSVHACRRYNQSGKPPSSLEYQRGEGKPPVVPSTKNQNSTDHTEASCAAGEHSHHQILDQEHLHASLKTLGDRYDLSRPVDGFVSATVTSPAAMTSSMPALPPRPGSSLVFFSPRKTGTSRPSASLTSLSFSSHDEDSKAIDEICKRFHRIFTTGDSFCTASYYKNHLSTTLPEAMEVPLNDTRTRSGLQVWMDHQYAAKLAEAEVSAHSNAVSGTNVTVNATSDSSASSFNNSLSTSFCHQALWMTAARAGTEILEEEEAAMGPHQSMEGQQATATTESSESSQLLHQGQHWTMEVSPGVLMRVATAKETWTAIQQGRITITTCFECQEELTVVEDLPLVVCWDCWTISPVDQTHQHKGDANSSVTSPPSSAKKEFVGLGVKTQDILEWIESGCRE